MEGLDLAGAGAPIVNLGFAHVPESRRLFPRMTVEDNLKMGGFTPAARRIRQQLAIVYELFRAAERRSRWPQHVRRRAAMCAIGRASCPSRSCSSSTSLGRPGPVIVEQSSSS